MQQTFKSPDELLKDLGKLVHAHRLDQNLTQAALAAKAGIGRNALVKLEGGAVVTTETLVRILNALNAASSITALLPAPQVSPMNLLRHKTERQRARTSRKPIGGP